MAEVNPLKVMLEPVLRSLAPWIIPASEVTIALALLYCLLLTARVARYPKGDPDAADARRKAQVSLRNAIISSLLVVAIVLLSRWGLESLIRWIGL